MKIQYIFSENTQRFITVVNATCCLGKNHV